MYLEALAGRSARILPRALNFGPQKAETLSVGEIASEIQKSFGIDQQWSIDDTDTPPEKALLSLNAELARQCLNWQPSWDTAQTLDKTVSWYKAMKEDQNMYEFSLSQINEYEAMNG